MKFIIIAPPYNSKSAGVVALYELNQSLKNLGYDSNLVSDYISYNLVNNYDTVVIYPERIHNNPLNAKNVVRYMLNVDKLHQHRKPIEFSSTDFILTWLDFFHEAYHAQLWKPSIPEFFNDKSTLSMFDRKIDCVYFGKGTMFVECKLLPNTIQIHNLSKKSLAELLRNTRILYTYDPLTSLNSEAILCGAVVCILNYKPFKPYQIDSLIPNVKVSDDNLIINLNYNEQRQNHISLLNAAVENYDNNLKIVIDKIKDHFNLI